MCFHKTSRVLDTLGRCVTSNEYIVDDFDSCDYVEQIKICDNDLMIVQLNIHGVNSKKDRLSSTMHDCIVIKSPDVLLLCETWLTPFSPF